MVLIVLKVLTLVLKCGTYDVMYTISTTLCIYLCIICKLFLFS